MPNVLISSKTESEWRTILGHPQLIDCKGINVSRLQCSEPGGSDVYLNTVKK